MSWVGFEPTISAGERPKTYALDRAATGTGRLKTIPDIKCNLDDTLFSSAPLRDTYENVIILPLHLPVVMLTPLSILRIIANTKQKEKNVQSMTVLLKM